jgi:uncharacterized protein YecE (DUF72 family)
VSSQLSLFGTDPEPAPALAAALAQVHAEAGALAAQLPAEVYFGTSSWSFPGWAGIVYSRERSTSELARDGLREYARHPLLRTVGIDRSFYAPIPVDDLRAYASQLPAGFRCCLKAPAAVTSVSLGPRGGPAALNPDFLSIERFADDLLNPLALAFRDHTGPIILEFPPFGRGRALAADEFHERLDRFCGQLPRDFEYAVELRDRTLLTPRYRALLHRHGLAHTYNYWSAMPMPAEQADVVPPEDAPFSIVRLLLKPGTWYDDQREAFRPFNRLVEPDARMRDDVTAVAGRALQRRKRVFILVNNKAEGSSPLTVMALARRLAGVKAGATGAAGAAGA